MQAAPFESAADAGEERDIGAEPERGELPVARALRDGGGDGGDQQGDGGDAVGEAAEWAVWVNAAAVMVLLPERR